jgi:murein L,D-transpeptidase YcbB/YkuD
LHRFCRHCRVFAVIALSLGPLLSFAQPLQPRFEDEVQRLLQEAQHPFLRNGDFSKERAAVNAAYEEHAFGPFWVTGAGTLSPQALALLQAMRAADERGLDPGEYEADKITVEAGGGAGQDTSRRAQIDVAVSIAATRFVTHLHYGRIDPNAVGFEMPARSLFDLRKALEGLATAADTPAALASIEPQFHHYQLLKQALATYRQLALQPQMTQLPSLPVKSIKPGEAYAGAGALRMLLAALGDLPEGADAGNTDPSVDEQVVSAIKRFQFRHGLRQDGALGPETYAELTTPLSMRVRQIELTLERWRWLPTLDAPTIIVNIPQFRLFAFPTSEDRETQMLTMDVIVGKTFPKTRTPVFAADMKYVKFRPYWDVPYSIMTAEMLPHIRADATFLQKHDLEIVGSQDDAAKPLDPSAQNIAALAAGKLRVRQRPGPDNSLGLVKFMLPNRHNVYLHSTPARGLFQESRRAFSHGCIRVSDPVALAQYVLRNATGEWPREKIEATLSGADNLRVDLKQWIRVLIVYGTAVATEAGSVYFFDDLYGNDARLAHLLSHRPEQ